MNKSVTGEGYRGIFNNSTATMLIMDTDAPHYTVLDVNEAYLRATNTTRDTLIGYSVFAAFPANPTDEFSKNIERTIYSFEQAIQTKMPHTMSNYRYDIPVRGTDQFEERYWTTTNSPVLDAEGNVKFFIHSPSDVTDLYQAEQRERASLDALRYQRSLLHSIFMQAPVGVGIFRGPDYIVDLINEPLCKLYGKSPEDLMGKPIFTALPHAKGIGFEDLLDQVMLTGTAFKGNEVAIPLVRDGVLETVYVNFVYEPFREQEGNITGVIVVATEVSEQRKAKEEQQKLITLVANSVDLMSILNMDGTNAYINEAGRKMLGFDSENDVMQTPISALHDPKDYEMVQSLVLPSVMKDGKWAGVMYVKHLKTREIFPVYNNCIRIDDPITKQPIGVGAVMRDLRPEMIAKQALEASEKLLRDITTAAPTGLWKSDHNGLINYVNQTWLDWTGRSFEANLGNGWIESILESDRCIVVSKFSHHLEQRTRFEAEFRIQRQDGSVHWCTVTGEPQYSAGGLFSGYIGAYVDITEQKHLQQQKDDFIAIASHELKTPVTSIKAYAQVLERMLLKNRQSTEATMIGKMDTQLNRLTNLIGDLLDVTKITAGKLRFNQADFDFNSMVRDLLEELQLTTSTHTLVDELGQTTTVCADKERIGQVVTNLVSNAIKYSKDADQVIISSHITDGHIHFRVKDFGIGIPDDKLEKVFEQFYRIGGNMQHTYPGLGLGLYISADIIARENGKIWAESKEGQGATFCFLLPLKSR